MYRQWKASGSMAQCRKISVRSALAFTRSSEIAGKRALPSAPWCRRTRRKSPRLMGRVPRRGERDNSFSLKINAWPTPQPQGNRERVTAQHHERFEPPDRPLGVGVGAISANPMSGADMKKAGEPALSAIPCDGRRFSAGSQPVQQARSPP
jgi:hypothetical protein